MRRRGVARGARHRRIRRHRRPRHLRIADGAHRRRPGNGVRRRRPASRCCPTVRPTSTASRSSPTSTSSSACTSTKTRTRPSAATCSAAWAAARASATRSTSKAAGCASRRSTGCGWRRCGCRSPKSAPPRRTRRHGKELMRFGRLKVCLSAQAAVIQSARSKPQRVRDHDHRRAGVGDDRHPQRRHAGHGGDDERRFHHQRDREVRLDVAHRRAAQAERVGNLQQLVGHQRDVGGFERGVAAGRAHRDADVGRRERRRVVHAVAHHRHRSEPPAQLLDRGHLVFRQQLGAELVDAELGGDRPGGRRGCRPSASRATRCPAAAADPARRVQPRAADRPRR